MIEGAEIKLMEISNVLEIPWENIQARHESGK